MKTIRLLGMLAVFLCTAQIAMATDYYVRAGATGANNGADWTNAYTSLPGTLVRGATYYIADGTYGSHKFGDAVSATTYIYIKKATTTDHGPAADWQASYGDGRATFSGWTFNTGYYDINGQTGGGPSNWDSGFGLEVTGTKGRRVYFSNSAVSHVTIKHTEIYNTDNTANDVSFGHLVEAIAGNVTYITFSYCKIHHVFGCNFKTRNGNDSWIVEYSKVGDNTGTSSNHSETWSRYGEDNWVWRYNYIYQWRSTGCMYAVGPGVDGSGDINVSENIHIYGNIFDQGGTTSSWLLAANNDGQTDFQYARGWRVYNNTFININSSADGVYAFALDTTGVSDNEFKNNIFYGNSDRMTIFGATEDYNSYQGSSQFFSGAHDSLLTSSPFVNYSAGDYRLSAGFAGVALGTEFATDLFGNPRGSDGTWDKGAYEFGGTPVVVTKPFPPTNLRVN